MVRPTYSRNRQPTRGTKVQKHCIFLSSDLPRFRKDLAVTVVSFWLVLVADVDGCIDIYDDGSPLHPNEFSAVFYIIRVGWLIAAI